MNKKQRLQDILEDSPNLIFDIIEHDPNLSDRMLCQIKCVEKFKYEESRRQEQDIGWHESWRLWIDRGYAQRFSDFYSPSESFRIIYEKIRKN